MENLTPGRKLILDLLAKSIAKIQAAEAENEVRVEDVKTDGRKGRMKRESMKGPEKFKKKMKAEKKTIGLGYIGGTKEELHSILKPGDIKSENEVRMEDVKTDGRKGRMKRESMKGPGKFRKKMKAEKKTIGYIDGTKEELHSILKPGDIKAENAEDMDKKKRSKKENKVDYSEYKLVIKDTKLKTTEVKIKSKEGKRKDKDKENLETPFKIKTEYTEIKTEEIDVKTEFKTNKLQRSNISNIVKNENNKDRIKVDDKIKIRSDTSVIKKEPAKQNLKKEYLNLQSDLTMENKDLISKAKSNESGKKYKTRKRISGFSSKTFSPEEDQIILNAIEKFGDKIDISQIAEDLQRTVRSIRNEVRKLKAGKEKKKKRRFTLSEDIKILDAVLKNVDKESLEEVNLTQNGWREVGTQIGKADESARGRWSRKLRLWILQHFAGTLNLEIRRPLANYLAENFTDINSVDWNSVVNKPEFAGHTNTSLRYKFSDLFKLIKESLQINHEDITLEMVAEFANTKYAAGERKIPDRELKRQQEIIEYFECYVETNCIKDFL